MFYLNKDWGLSNETNNEGFGIYETEDLGRCFGIYGILKKSKGTMLGDFLGGISALSNTSSQ